MRCGLLIDYFDPMGAVAIFGEVSFKGDINSVEMSLIVNVGGSYDGVFG